MLEKQFKLADHDTTTRREILAGATAFLTMAYIVFVNPSTLADAGMDRDAAFVATCLAAAFGSLLMGVLANYPIALAPGMGLNAFSPIPWSGRWDTRGKPPSARSSCQV